MSRKGLFISALLVCLLATAGAACASQYEGQKGNPALMEVIFGLAQPESPVPVEASGRSSGQAVLPRTLPMAQINLLVRSIVEGETTQGSFLFEEGEQLISFTVTAPGTMDSVRVVNAALEIHLGKNETLTFTGPCDVLRGSFVVTKPVVVPK